MRIVILTIIDKEVDGWAHRQRTHRHSRHQTSR
jgi:hypothetical protein